MFQTTTVRLSQTRRSEGAADLIIQGSDLDDTARAIPVDKAGSSISGSEGGQSGRHEGAKRRQWVVYGLVSKWTRFKDN